MSFSSLPYWFFFSHWNLYHWYKAIYPVRLLMDQKLRYLCVCCFHNMGLFFKSKSQTLRLKPIFVLSTHLQMGLGSISGWFALGQNCSFLFDIFCTALIDETSSEINCSIDYKKNRPFYKVSIRFCHFSLQRHVIVSTDQCWLIVGQRLLWAACWWYLYAFGS